MRANTISARVGIYAMTRAAIAAALLALLATPARADSFATKFGPPIINWDCAPVADCPLAPLPPVSDQAVEFINEAAIIGPATVVDGDTIRIGGERIRLFGIDAPERAQTCDGADGQTYECGRDAAAVMTSLVRDRTVTCEPHGRDRYGRTVAICSTEAGDIGAAMVRAGWAVRYARYDTECRYCADEAAAKAERRGMWSGRFDMPEMWRRARR